ncbi:hypothetical protein FA15DRAFT_719035 [Coprinopsis marcescibilis]|uniref:Uncharacterized protein n=1 Tax=Coprinopsis marcescibilis TaxID=230819 RepID=A0A5C3KY22_COPMA|nr:hypothetical protein FA15DRAFT_719035 [Coprinopsis marcescibilis]
MHTSALLKLFVTLVVTTFLAAHQVSADETEEPRLSRRLVGSPIRIGSPFPRTQFPPTHPPLRLPRSSSVFRARPPRIGGRDLEESTASELYRRLVSPCKYASDVSACQARQRTSIIRYKRDLLEGDEGLFERSPVMAPRYPLGLPGRRRFGIYGGKVLNREFVDDGNLYEREFVDDEGLYEREFDDMEEARDHLRAATISVYTLWFNYYASRPEFLVGLMMQGNSAGEIIFDLAGDIHVASAYGLSENIQQALRRMLKADKDPVRDSNIQNRAPGQLSTVILALLVQALIAVGADVGVRDVEGRTALANPAQLWLVEISEGSIWVFSVRGTDRNV